MFMGANCSKTRTDKVSSDQTLQPLAMTIKQPEILVNRLGLLMKPSEITQKQSEISKKPLGILKKSRELATPPSGILVKPSGATKKQSEMSKKQPDIKKKRSDKSIKTDSFRNQTSSTNILTEEVQQREILYQVYNPSSSTISTCQMPDGSRKEKLSFVCISDTHGKLTEEVISQIPHADVLLHAGDFTMNGSVRELIQFNKFLGRLSHTVKIVIAGNHEACLEDDMFLEARFINNHYREKYGVKEIRELLTNCIYLQDELTEIYGIKIYGSPWTPEYSSCNAFSLCSRDDCQQEWDKIPTNIDILMTHGPPRGFGDTTIKHVSAGCSSLMEAVQNRIKPKYHVFGHIHEGYGVYKDETTTYINAALCTRGYKPTNQPIKFQLNIPKPNTCDIDCTIHTYSEDCDVNSCDSADCVNCDT